MSAVMMPGAPVRDAVFAELRPRIDALVERGFTPGLGTILVGSDSASEGYIRLKQRTAAELGVTSPHIHLPDDATQADLLAAIREFNEDPAVDGYLVQHPTPPQIDFDAALLAIDPDKDVDGLHPVNVGRLALSMPGPVSCTPAGIEALLAFYEIPVAGREVCILGRGTTLGRPLGILLSQKRPTANAAVTVVHTGVPDWPRYTQRARDRGGGGRCPRHSAARAHHARLRGGGGRRPVRGQDAAARCGRALRSGGGLDHPPGRRRRPHHHRHALPQRH